jgi:hypothetical protein
VLRIPKRHTTVPDAGAYHSLSNIREGTEENEVSDVCFIVKNKTSWLLYLDVICDAPHITSYSPFCLISANLISNVTN